jgi:glycosyltransferase involved in cell wall biosynthesis
LRKIIIGTPSHDGTLEANYVNSLIQTVLLSASKDIQVYPLFICYDSLVQRARNDLINYAIAENVDDLVFIDSDESWSPEDFLKLLSHNVDVVGGTARKKNDEEQYVLKVDPTIGLQRKENGLIEVLGVGTGFTRLSRYALNILWNCSEGYVEDNGKAGKMVFNIEIVDGVLVSEDIVMCSKLSKNGVKIWFDPTITCDHIGVKNYKGDFLEWEKRLQV